MSARTLIIAAAALAASGVVVAPASADTPRPAGQPPLRAAVMFNLLDRNGDGVIDLDEANAVTVAIFKSIDGDGDGKLTKEELGAVHKLMRRGGGPGFDRHPGRRHGHGGTFQGMGPRTGMMGAGGDKGDMSQGGMGQMMGQGGQMMGPDGPGGPGGRMHDFATLDANGDGSISREEFDAAVAMFPGMRPAQ